MLGSEKRIMPKLQPLQHNTTNLRSIFTQRDIPCPRNNQTTNHEEEIFTLSQQGSNKCKALDKPGTLCKNTLPRCPVKPRYPDGDRGVLLGTHHIMGEGGG